MKDWTGTQASIFKAIAATNHTDARRAADDFYATHPSAIDALLDYPHLTLPHHIWEPSCGAGHLSRRLVERGYEVTSTDLIDRGYGTGGADFFLQRSMPSPDITCILTNPPYKYATRYAIHALTLLPADGFLCLFLKTTFAEGTERHCQIFHPHPPLFVLQCVRRIPCAPGGDFSTLQGSAVAYAWWIWRKGHTGPTTLDWINK